MSDLSDITPRSFVANFERLPSDLGFIIIVRATPPHPPLEEALKLFPDYQTNRQGDVQEMQHGKFNRETARAFEIQVSRWPSWLQGLRDFRQRPTAAKLDEGLPL